MVESFLFKWVRALRSTWAQINGLSGGDKSGGMCLTVNQKATFEGLLINSSRFATLV